MNSLNNYEKPVVEIIFFEKAEISTASELDPNEENWGEWIP